MDSNFYEIILRKSFRWFQKWKKDCLGTVLGRFKLMRLFLNASLLKAARNNI